MFAHVCSVTLHPSGTELLPGEENGVVVILCVPCVLFLLQEGPATHVLQTLGRVPQFDQGHGLERETGKQTDRQLERRAGSGVSMSWGGGRGSFLHDNDLSTTVGGSVTMS